MPRLDVSVTHTSEDLDRASIVSSTSNVSVSSEPLPDDAAALAAIGKSRGIPELRDAKMGSTYVETLDPIPTVTVKERPIPAREEESLTLNQLFVRAGLDLRNTRWGEDDKDPKRDGPAAEQLRAVMKASPGFAGVFSKPGSITASVLSDALYRHRLAPDERPRDKWAPIIEAHPLCRWAPEDVQALICAATSAAGGPAHVDTDYVLELGTKSVTIGIRGAPDGLSIRHDRDLSGFYIRMDESGAFTLRACRVDRLAISVPPGCALTMDMPMSDGRKKRYEAVNASDVPKEAVIPRTAASKSWATMRLSKDGREVFAHRLEFPETEVYTDTLVLKGTLLARELSWNDDERRLRYYVPDASSNPVPPGLRPSMEIDGRRCDRLRLSVFDPDRPTKRKLVDVSLVSEFLASSDHAHPRVVDRSAWEPYPWAPESVREPEPGSQAAKLRTMRFSFEGSTSPDAMLDSADHKPWSAVKIGCNGMGLSSAVSLNARRGEQTGKINLVCFGNGTILVYDGEGRRVGKMTHPYIARERS
jgi:hypothetical protein